LAACSAANQISVRVVFGLPGGSGYGRGRCVYRLVVEGGEGSNPLISTKEDSRLQNGQPTLVWRLPFGDW